MFTKTLIANRGDSQRGRAANPFTRATCVACGSDLAAETRHV